MSLDMSLDPFDCALIKDALLTKRNFIASFVGSANEQATRTVDHIDAMLERLDEYSRSFGVTEEPKQLRSRIPRRVHKGFTGDCGCECTCYPWYGIHAVDCVARRGK